MDFEDQAIESTIVHLQSLRKTALKGNNLPFNALNSIEKILCSKVFFLDFSVSLDLNLSSTVEDLLPFISIGVNQLRIDNSAQLADFLAEDQVLILLDRLLGHKKIKFELLF